MQSKKGVIVKRKACCSITHTNEDIRLQNNNHFRCTKLSDHVFKSLKKTILLPLINRKKSRIKAIFEKN